MTVETPPESSASTWLAFERTSMAYDRTLLAWIRTATSLITFGFAFYKFFHLELHRKLEQGQLVGPREFAVLMISIGLFALAASAIQYRLDRKRLRAQYADIPGSLAGWVAALISILGIVAFLAVIFRA